MKSFELCHYCIRRAIYLMFDVLSMTFLETAVFCNVTPYSAVALSQLSLESCYSRDQCRMVGCPKDGVNWVVGLLAARLQNVHLGT